MKQTILCTFSETLPGTLVFSNIKTTMEAFYLCIFYKHVEQFSLNINGETLNLEKRLFQYLETEGNLKY